MEAFWVLILLILLIGWGIIMGTVNNKKFLKFNELTERQRRVARNKEKLKAAKPGELPVSSFYEHAVRKGYKKIIEFCESKTKGDK